jgi:membrane-bound lytic murein transglycosylase A
VPLGAPVYIHDADRREVDGLWVAQDVGGAIKGPNRFDTFWGSGADAAGIAGGMSANGQALILVPKGVAARALPQP